MYSRKVAEALSFRSILDVPLELLLENEILSNNRDFYQFFEDISFSRMNSNRTYRVDL